MKVNDEAVRMMRKPEVREPKRRWNYKKCIPLKVFLWLLAAAVCTLATMPIWLYLAKGMIQ